MDFDELKQKALSLPYEPGVYIMQDKSNTVIYVGKAKKLKNRVSQYFQDTAAHTPKTRQMVSRIDHFDVIVARSEFEALVLECSLIKRHMPKYNILLKDDKGYPYIRVDLRQDYPVFELARTVQNDGAEYFGPYSSRRFIIDTLCLALKLPRCGKKFPRDLGKERPCLNFHMNNCDGWCQLSRSPQEYRERISEAVQLLRGNYQQVAEQIRAEMEQAAERLEFELAAALRDRLKTVESFSQKQLVTAGSMANTDVIGYYQSEAKAAFSVLHYVDGNLLDKDYEILPPSDDEQEAVSTLVKQYYLAKGAAPKIILVPCFMEDAPLFEQLLFEQFGRRVHIRQPQRGDGLRMMALAQKNAREEAERVTTRAERAAGSWNQLAQMLGIESLHRAESYDISNIAGTDIVASMVVWKDAKPSKSDYKHFKLEGLQDQDDYASMRQVLHRRFVHYLDQDAGFAEKPDVLLIDGGIEHAKLVRQELEEMEISVPVFGMVKDGRHRTRALVTPDGRQIGIAAFPSVFALIGSIQEETHRFAITYHRQLRSKRMKQSSLENIPGVGPKRRSLLLKRFKTVKAVQNASLSELAEVVPAHTAQEIYAYYHQEETSCE